ncbi:MAG: SOS response-associated peptidase, partial [Rhizobiaceae bacterium]|nr:SOS response-associated peptidase [Rhizobiaceae bacterium]
MCGRFSLTATPEEVAELLGLDMLEAFPPRYNIAPTQPVLMANINAANKRVATLVRWGLVPAWVKEPKEFSLLINARCETAGTKPSFRNAMRHRRTLIPASGFYEWKRSGEKKQAYWVRSANGNIVMFGGLMETWAGADGSEIDSGCILTTASNAQLSKIHHRMPVVIKPEDYERWLDCKTREPRDVADLTAPIEEGYFEAVAVSELVNQ